MPNTIIHVDLVDADGYSRGRSIPVAIEFYECVDRSYGEDADGGRATLLVTREILDAWITAEDLMTLNSADVEYCLDEARFIFAGRIR